MSEVTDDVIELEGISDAPIFDKSVLDRLLVWLAEQPGSSSVLIRSGDAPGVRINGVWQRVGYIRLLNEHIATVLTEIYQQSAVAQLQGRRPLNFRYQIHVRRGYRLGFRVNVVPGHSARDDIGFKLTFRPIPALPPAATELGLESEIWDAVRPRQGLVLINGATGSGKSTLLASVMAHRLQTEGINLITIEAPIEYDYENLSGVRGFSWQMEVGTHTDDVNAALVEAMRQEPDVLLLGEVRDQETVAGILSATNTGHAAYTTTHTNGVKLGILRLVDHFYGDEAWKQATRLIETIELSIHQRLVPKKGGGRIALREFLVYDETVRNRLYAAGEIGHAAETERLLYERGQPIIADARRKHAEGLIDDTVLAQVEASEREVAADG